MLAACKSEPIHILKAERLAAPPTKVSPDLAKLNPVAFNITIASPNLEQFAETDFNLHACPWSKRQGWAELYIGDVQIRESGDSSVSERELRKLVTKGPVTITAVAPGLWVNDEDYLCGHFEYSAIMNLFADPKVSAIVRFPSIWKEPSYVGNGFVRSMARKCGIAADDYTVRAEASQMGLMIEDTDRASAEARGTCLVQNLRNARVRAGFGTIIFQPTVPKAEW